MIKPLETIVCTLEVAMQLNNKIESALCWVYNSHAAVPEWQVKICEKFASIEAIQAAIDAGIFYYAPTLVEMPAVKPTEITAQHTTASYRFDPFHPVPPTR